MKPMMDKFRVVERRADSSHFSLRCSSGRYHVARSLDLAPQLDAALNGAKPHLDFGLLVGTSSGTVFRVFFEAINAAGPALDGHAVVESAINPSPSAPCKGRHGRLIAWHLLEALGRAVGGVTLSVKSRLSDIGPACVCTHVDKQSGAVHCRSALRHSPNSIRAQLQCEINVVRLPS
jgi:hypothetical protein